MKPRRRSARGKPGFEISDRVRQTWEFVTTTLALLTAIYLILNTIEPTRIVLERYVGKLNEQSVIAIVAVMLEVTIIAVYQLGRQVRALRTTVITDRDEDIHYDVGAILSTYYGKSTSKRRTGRRLEVIGLSLNTTWPTLAPWLTSQDRPTGWHITLWHLDPEFVERSTELPSDWADEARRSRDRIRQFLVTEADELARLRITVELKAYSCVPVVHGFRFGSGDLFLSYLQWSEHDRIRPFEFYEHISAGNTSRRADHYRDLFDGWLSRVERRATVPSVDGTVA